MIILLFIFLLLGTAFAEGWKEGTLPLQDQAQAQGRHFGNQENYDFWVNFSSSSTVSKNSFPKLATRTIIFHKSGLILEWTVDERWVNILNYSKVDR